MEGLQVAYLLTKRGQVVKLETKQVKTGQKMLSFRALHSRLQPAKPELESVLSFLSLKML